MPSPLKPNRSKSVFNLLAWNNTLSIIGTSPGANSRQNGHFHSNKDNNNYNIKEENELKEVEIKQRRIDKDLKPLKEIWTVFIEEFPLETVVENTINEDELAKYTSLINTILAIYLKVDIIFGTEDFDYVFGEKSLLIKYILITFQIHFDKALQDIYTIIDGKLEKLENIFSKSDVSTILKLNTHILKTFFESKYFILEKFFLVINQILEKMKSSDIVEIVSNSKGIISTLEYFTFFILLTKETTINSLEKIDLSGLKIEIEENKNRRRSIVIDKNIMNNSTLSLDLSIEEESYTDKSSEIISPSSEKLREEEIDTNEFSKNIETIKLATLNSNFELETNENIKSSDNRIDINLQIPYKNDTSEENEIDTNETLEKLEISYSTDVDTNYPDATYLSMKNAETADAIKTSENFQIGNEEIYNAQQDLSLLNESNTSYDNQTNSIETELTQENTNSEIENNIEQCKESDPQELLLYSAQKRPIQFFKVIDRFLSLVIRNLGDFSRKNDFILIFIQQLASELILSDIIPIKLTIFNHLQGLIGNIMDVSTCELLLKKKYITNLLQLLKPTTIQSRFSVSQIKISIDYISTSFIIQTLVKILESSQNSNNIIMKTFQSSVGYKVIQDALIDHQDKFSIDDYMKMALKASVQLVYVIDRFSAENHLVMKQFSKEEIQKQNLKNAAAFNIFSQTFLKAQNDLLQQLALDEMLYLIAEYGKSSPIVHQWHPIALYIKNLDSVSDSNQDSVLKIIEFMIAGIDIVPKEELLSLLQLLESNTKSTIIEKILTLFTKILHLKTEFLSIFRDMGVLSQLLNLFTKFSKGATNLVESSVMELATDVLVELLKDSTNLKHFRDIDGVAVMQGLVLNDICRKHALKIFQTIIVYDSIQNQVDVSVLVELLQNSPWAKVSVKTSIFNGLIRILKDNHSAKDSFAEAGFVASMSVLINSQWKGGVEPTSKYEGENNVEPFTLQDQMNMFEALFKAITAALTDHHRNKAKFESHVGENAIIDGLQMSNIMETNCAKDIIQFILDMTTERLFHPNENIVGSDIEYIEGLNIGLDPIIYNIFSLKLILKLLQKHNIFYNQNEVALRLIDTFSKSCSYNLEQLSSISISSYIFDNYNYAIKDILHPHHFICFQIIERMACYKQSTLEWKEQLSLLHNPQHVDNLMKTISIASSSTEYNETPFLEFMENSKTSIISLEDKIWPPAQGYTFMGWVFLHDRGNLELPASKKQQHVATLLSIRSDDNRTTLDIGISSDGQIMFNSHSRSKYSIFTNFTFDFNKWYHIVMTHSKYRILQSSSAVSLYVNGKFIESHKISYPGSSGSGLNVRGTFGHHMGLTIQSKKFSLRIGPSLFYEELIPTENIPYFFISGRAYIGTYGASRSMKYLDQAYSSSYISLFEPNSQMPEEALKKHNHDMTLYKLKKTKLLPDKLLFSFNAYLVKIFDLAQGSGTNMGQKTNAMFLLNAKNSIFASRCKAMLQGPVFCCTPVPFSSIILSIDGIKVIFALIDRSDTSSYLLQSLDILRNLMFDSPFVLQEVMRQNGWTIIASFLSKKIHLINESIIDCLWRIVTLESLNHSEIVSFKNFCKNVFLDHENIKRYPARIQIYLYKKILGTLKDPYYPHFNTIRLKSMGLIPHLIRYLMDSPPLETIPIAVEIIKILVISNPTSEDMNQLTRFLSWTLLNEFKPVQLHKDAIFQATGSVYSKHTRIQKSSIFILTSIITSRNLILKMLLETLNLEKNFSDQMIDLFSKHMDVRWFSQFLVNPVHPSSMILILPLWCALIEREKFEFTIHLFNSSIMGYCNQKEIYRVLFALQMGGTRGYLFDSFKNHFYFDTIIERPWLLINNSALPLILTLLKSASRNASTATFPNIVFTDCLDESKLVSMMKKYQAQLRWKLIEKFVKSRPFIGGLTTHDAVDLTINQEKIKSKEIENQHSLVIEIFQVIKNLFKKSEEFRNLLQKPENLNLLIGVAFSNVSLFPTNIKASSTGDVQIAPKLEDSNLGHMKSVPTLSLIPSPNESKIISTKEERESYQYIFKQELTVATLDVVNSILEYHLNATGKCIRTLEDILEEHPKLISSEIIDCYKETILINFIETCRNHLSLFRTNGIVRSNLCAFCPLLITYYANGIITNYEIVLQFFSELIYHLHIYETEKTLGKPGNLSTKEMSIQTVFKYFNRFFVYLLKIENQDFDRMFYLLQNLLDRDWLVAALNPSNFETNFFGILAHFFFPFIVLSDSTKLRDLAVTCLKLIVISNKLLIDSSTIGVNINKGLSEILNNNPQDFIQWLLQNQDDILNYFKVHYEDLSQQYINFINDEKKRKSGKTNTITRKISTGRPDARNEQYFLLKHDCQQMLDSLKKDHERKIQNQKEQAIISRNFANEQWKTLKTDLFHERAAWFQNENVLQKKQIDFSDNPLRMRKKLINLQNEELILNPTIPPTIHKASSTEDLSSQNINSLKEIAIPFDDEILNRRRQTITFDEDLHRRRESVYLFENFSKVEELLLSPNKRITSFNNFEEDDIGDPDTDGQSMTMTHNETETGVISDTAIDEDEYSIIDEEYFEDDMDEDFKIRKHLDTNETILHTFNCIRVNGLDGQKALFVVGVNAMYIIDNYTLSEENEIMEVDALTEGENQGEVNATSPTTLNHTCTKISFSNLKNVMKRRFLLLETAIEFFCKDGQSYLVVYEKSEMLKVYQYIPQHCRKTINKKLITSQWQRGEISNFDYLMLLNTLAGRSYNDLTQYPIFPWVLCQFDGEEIDLQCKSSYRDLSKPMGAITDSRKNAFEERFNLWDDPKIPKFHYGSHYSSAAIVLYYMIRLEPFTSQNIQLQGGKFDISDRLFFSIHETFKNATEDRNMSDVKELIPEFYYLPDFLTNRDNLDLGVRSNKKSVGDVELPLWCNNDTHEFIRLNRKALESDIVSESLHLWIDLIFGFKQKGIEAQKAVNVFYYLTYEGAVDIDTITDPIERRATIAQISSFGQTPKQIFTKSHPKRINKKTIPLITDDPLLLIYNEIKRVNHSVGYLGYNLRDQLIILKSNSVLASSKGKKFLNWSDIDGTLRIFSTTVPNALTKSHEILKKTWENLHSTSRFTTITVTEDGEIMVTGDHRGLVCIWAIFGLRRNGKHINQPQLRKRLCAHDGSITCVQICENYAIIISGSEDGTCVVWDLNKATYLLTLKDVDDSPIVGIDVNQYNGDIVMCTSRSISLWTINGELIARNEAGSPVTSIKLLYENGWNDNYFIVTGHLSGTVTFWKIVYHGKEKGKIFIEDERKTNIKLYASFSAHTSRITCFFVTKDKRKLFSGDDRGHVIQWVRNIIPVSNALTQIEKSNQEKSSPDKNIEIIDDASNSENSLELDGDNDIDTDSEYIKS